MEKISYFLSKVYKNMCVCVWSAIINLNLNNSSGSAQVQIRRWIWYM